MKLKLNGADFLENDSQYKKRYVTQNINLIKIYNFYLERFSVRWIFSEMQRSQSLTVHSATAVVSVAFLE